MFKSNATADKMEVEKEGVQARIAELSAKAKEATADARIAIEHFINYFYYYGKIRRGSQA